MNTSRLPILVAVIAASFVAAHSVAQTAAQSGAYPGDTGCQPVATQPAPQPGEPPGDTGCQPVAAQHDHRLAAYAPRDPAVPCVERHAELRESARWESSAPALCSIGEEEGRLCLTINAVSSNGAFRATLREPIPVPDGCEFFIDAAKSGTGALPFRAIVLDAADREWLYEFTGRAFLDDSSFFGGGFRPGVFHCGEWRMATVALGGLRSWGVAAADGKAGKPERPLRFAGFELLAKGNLGRNHKVWIRDFRFTDAREANTSFLYALWGQPQFGEADGPARISPLDVSGKLMGKRHVFEWEARDSFEGPPVWQGCVTNEAEATCCGGGGVEVPLRTPGSYWIRMKATPFGKNGAPQNPSAFEYRYDVFRSGDVGNPPAPVPESQWLPVTRERIAEQRRIREEGYPWGHGLPARDGATGSQAGSLCPQEVPPRSGSHGVLAPPSGGSAGEPPAPPEPPATSLVEFCYMGRDAAGAIDLLDQMAALGQRETLEIQTMWPELEPLDGVFDFRPLDSVLDAAAERGISCIVTFAPLYPPAWMPDEFTRNECGDRFGHRHYLFNGGRLNIHNAPFPRGRFLRFVEEAVRHVQNHPALLGYFYIVEHGGDFPWRDWYEGYDDFTKAEYRKWLAGRFPSVESMNAAYGTDFPSFTDAEPPPQLPESAPSTLKPSDPPTIGPSDYSTIGPSDYSTIGPSDYSTIRPSPRRLADWRLFKRIRVETLQWDFCKLVRGLDPTRLIMVYGSPTLSDGVFDYGEVGNVVAANGGCHNFGNGYHLTMFSEAGLSQRSEEISCGNWMDKGPTQLDTSLFAVLHGGGMTHFKMFWHKSVKMDDPKARESRGLDRFLRFVPIFRELSGAERVDYGLFGWGRTFGKWQYELIEGAQLQIGTSLTPRWKGAKAVLASPAETEIDSARVAELAEYVRGGGTLFLTCETGSTLLDDPSATNALLRALGIGAPKPLPGFRCIASVSEDSPWRERFPADTAEPCRILVSGAEEAPDDAGEVLMRFGIMQEWQRKAGVAGRPALTRKRVGDGWAYVFWAKKIVPPSRAGEEVKAAADVFSGEASFLGEIVRDAGVVPPVRCDRRDIYSILLRKGETFYLALASPHGMPEAANIEIDLPLPSDSYEVTEMISGESAALPLRVRLGPAEVRIYRIRR